MIEVEDSVVLREERIQLRKTDQLFLICQGSGKVVFVQGDTSVMELKHSEIIQQNLFNLGFTLRSLLTAKEKYPNGLIDSARRKIVQIRMELLSRHHLLYQTKTQQNWKNAKKRLIKAIKMKCSLMKASFRKKKIKPRKTVVEKYFEVQQKQSQEEQQLILVEVQLRKKGVIKTKENDYRYVREKLLEELRFDLND